MPIANPKWSCWSEEAAVRMFLWACRHVCGKKWNEKGKCNVIGTFGWKNSFQYSSWVQPVSTELLCVIAMMPSGTKFCRKQPCWNSTTFTFTNKYISNLKRYTHNRNGSTDLPPCFSIEHPLTKTFLQIRLLTDWIGQAVTVEIVLVFSCAYFYQTTFMMTGNIV